jgi:hypothetical protein
VADHRHHAIVDQLLRRRRAHLRVGAVVLRLQHEADLLAADRQAFRIQVVDGHARAVLDVLALVGAGAGQRRHAADLYLALGLHGGCGQGQQAGEDGGGTDGNLWTHGLSFQWDDRL